MRAREERVKEKTDEKGAALFAPLCENKLPLILFHGSPCAFDAFHDAPGGIFFATNRDVAVAYAEGWEGERGSGYVIAAHVSMASPAVIDRIFLEQFERQHSEAIVKASPRLQSSLSFAEAFEDSETWARELVTQEVRARGHDGMIILQDLLPVNCMGGDWECQPSYAVFSKHQILRIPDPHRVAQANKALEFLCSAETKGLRP